MRKFAVLLIIFIGFICMACSEPGGSSSSTTITPPPDQTVGITDKAFLHLNITEGKIFNTSVNMEYTVIGNWSDTVECDGAVQDLNLGVGDHVIVRSIDTGDDWETDLGTVTALSGSPDFMPGNALYIGTGNFSDVIYAEPGESLRILSYMYNYGEYHSGTAFEISFYISDDKIIDGGDTLLTGVSYNYPWNFPTGETLCTWDDEFEFIVPASDPGTYYIGAIMDSSGVVDELNEGNNTTLPEDMATLIIQDNSVLASGAMKIVNSWGLGGSWQNVDTDGHYWMPFDVMKANNMAIYYYKNDFTTEYEPKVLVAIELDHPRRDECRVSIGLGDPDNPFVEKKLESSEWDGDPIGGSLSFPDNLMVVDITEFAYAINDSNLYLKIENTGATLGTIDQFSVEYYSDYSSMSIKTVDGWTGSFAGNRVSTAFASTQYALTRGELLSITPPVSSSSDGALLFYEEFPDADELAQDKQSLGVYVPGTNYNKLYQGKYGTGYKPPTEEYWDHMKKLRAIDTGLYQATFDGDTIPDQIDNSTSQYFPPIGNQGAEGSCAAFSMGYYIQTYTEAKEHGWDLSSASWGADPTGLSSGGRPGDSYLDMIFSPDFIYHQINDGVDEGSNMGQAAALIIRLGGATWDTMPYNTSDFTTWPKEAAWREAPKYRGEKVSNLYWDYDLSGYFTISTDADIQLLKTLLSQGYILSTGIHTDTVYTALDLNDVVADDGSATWYGSYYPDHAQTIVGYKEGFEWDSANPDS